MSRMGSACSVQRQRNATFGEHLNRRTSSDGVSRLFSHDTCLRIPFANSTNAMLLRAIPSFLSSC
jgi:hypothetical protein